jgi:hypothetical protein
MVLEQRLLLVDIMASHWQVTTLVTALIENA